MGQSAIIKCGARETTCVKSGSAKLFCIDQKPSTIKLERSPSPPWGSMRDHAISSDPVTSQIHTDEAFVRGSNK